MSDGEDNTGRQRGEVVVSVALGFRKQVPCSDPKPTSSPRLAILEPEPCFLRLVFYFSSPFHNPEIDTNQRKCLEQSKPHLSIDFPP